MWGIILFGHLTGACVAPNARANHPQHLHTHLVDREVTRGGSRGAHTHTDSAIHLRRELLPRIPINEQISFGNVSDFGTHKMPRFPYAPSSWLENQGGGGGLLYYCGLRSDEGRAAYARLQKNNNVE